MSSREPRPAAPGTRQGEARRRRAVPDVAFRLAYRLGYGLARQWWRLRRPPYRGTLVALWTPGGQLLLVRQSYRAGWTLPGGGVEAGESAAAAAVRELGEELAIAAEPDQLVPALQVTGDWDYRRERVEVFELRLPGIPVTVPDRREIVEARFVPREQLAALELSPPAASYVAEHLGLHRGNLGRPPRF